MDRCRVCHQLGHVDPKRTQQKSWAGRTAKNVTEEIHQELINADMEVTQPKENAPTEQNQMENQSRDIAIGQNHAKPPDQAQEAVTSPVMHDVVQEAQVSASPGSAAGSVTSQAANDVEQQVQARASPGLVAGKATLARQGSANTSAVENRPVVIPMKEENNQEERNEENHQEVGQSQVETIPETLISKVSTAKPRPQRARRVSESDSLQELLASEHP